MKFTTTQSGATAIRSNRRTRRDKVFARISAERKQIEMLRDALHCIIYSVAVNTLAGARAIAREALDESEAR